MPTTRSWGRPENSRSAQTIASSGLVMQMTKLSGAWRLMPSPTDFMTLRLMPRRSSRLIDRERVVEGRSVLLRVDLGGRGLIEKKKTIQKAYTLSEVLQIPKQ